MSERFEKFRGILAEMFQLDQADLDFGIYRIMNQKRDEITRFLDNDLLPQVEAAFAQAGGDEKNQLTHELLETEQSARALGLDPESVPKVRELRERLAVYGQATESVAAEVFSDLTNFFRRYYKEGDFISQPRYKAGVYAIPYAGEEVKLHWANADQYYIKTSEYFRDYAFKLTDGKTVHFKIVDAETEKDNNKADNEKERRFVLTEENTIAVENGELVIHFVYQIQKERQNKLNESALVTLQEKLADQAFADFAEVWLPMPTEKNIKRTLLEKQLNDYTAKNSFDYFIHKDLGGFLRRELDFYIKNEIMLLDDLDTENEVKAHQYLNKVKVIKRIGHKIIAFLAQLEDFQKKLWLKKKFIVETNYCITLDRVPEELYAEIMGNEAQLYEWKKLFTIENVEGFQEALTVDFLKENPYLLLDTAFFSQMFKDKLLSSIEDIDQQTDGLLVHSENFQALQLLQERYREQVKCIYIDPPYNTDSAPILYKNDYRHSSWLSLLSDRLRISENLLQTNEGVQIIAIDDTEMVNLCKILEEMFPYCRLSRISVTHNPKGSITKDFNRVHEYVLFLTPEENKKCIARLLEENASPRKMRRWGENSLRTERKLSFYPIYVKDNKVIRIGEVPPDDYHPNSRNVSLPSGEVAIWPIDQESIERRWNFGLDTVADNLDRITVQAVDGTLDLFLTHELTVPKTIWTGGDYDAGNYGNTLLINILGNKKFDYPKSILLVKRCVLLVAKDFKNSVVLDYFAGSGTTAHAVINLNREDDGSRKYILVEMGEYFNTVTKPRVQKVIYSKDWKDGKPVSREGSSHMFKYIRLESYEDTLNNLEFARTAIQQTLLDDHDKLREEYMLSYLLNVESQGSASLLNLDAFANPFDYKLKIVRNNETTPVVIDLPETFNYLLGLTVRRVEVIEGFKIIRGEMPSGEKTLIIWRNLKETSNADLDAFLDKSGYSPRNNKFDRIYVNGDNHIENRKTEAERWKVLLIEEEFKRLMFDVRDI